MRPTAFLLLAALACGAPDRASPSPSSPGEPPRSQAAESSLAQAASPLPVATFALPRVQPATLAELPPEGPDGPVPFSFEDSGCRFVRPALEKPPARVPSPRLCEWNAPDTSGHTTFDSAGRPVEGSSCGASMCGASLVRLDAKGRVAYRHLARRGDDDVWFRYDDANVERVAVRVADGRINYAVAVIAPDCRSIRWDWRSANFLGGRAAGEWMDDHWRLEEFDASGVLVAVTLTAAPSAAAERTTYRYHSNGVVAREEVTRADRQTVREFDPAGHRVFESTTVQGALTSGYTATYDADGHRVASDEWRPEGDPQQRTYRATYDQRGHLLRKREVELRLNSESATDDSLQWSGDLLLREERTSSTRTHLADGSGDSESESKSVEVHTYDRRGLRIRTSFDYAGSRAVSFFEYDTHDRLLAEDHRTNSPTSSYRRTLEYDAAGRKTLERTTYSDGRVEESTWTWCE